MRTSKTHHSVLSNLQNNSGHEDYSAQPFDDRTYNMDHMDTILYLSMKDNLQNNLFISSSSLLGKIYLGLYFVALG